MRSIRPVLVATVVLAVACGTSNSNGAEYRSSETSADVELSRYPDIPSLREDLVSAGIACELEYEGLEDPDRVVSICTIDGEEALLTIWKDPGMLADFLATGEAPPTMAHGENWSVEVDSAPVAEDVAEATGGTTPAG